MEFATRTATDRDREALYDVISTVGWGITRESIGAIQTWDPEAYLVAEGPEGRTLGVIFGLGYPRTGWLGHLVVRPECRGVGVGRALFGQALARLRALGKEPIHLTATAMGENLYRRFGFVDNGNWSRWQGSVPPGGLTRPPSVDGLSVEPLREADLADVVAFDAERFGEERGFVLRWLFRTYPEGGRVARRPTGEVAGYFLPGTEGLGPFLTEEDAARPLFAAALATFAGRPASFTFPDGNVRARSLCQEAGLAPCRTWLRMRLGDDPMPPRDECIFNASVAKG